MGNARQSAVGAEVLELRADAELGGGQPARLCGTCGPAPLGVSPFVAEWERPVDGGRPNVPHSATNGGSPRASRSGSRTGPWPRQPQKSGSQGASQEREAARRPRRRGGEAARRRGGEAARRRGGEAARRRGGEAARRRGELLTRDGEPDSEGVAARAGRIAADARFVGSAPKTRVLGWTQPPRQDAM